MLLKGANYPKLYARGIAKCAPGDCFNVHIGKAISLRRALGLEVPAEYLNAPAPTEVRVGDVIRNEYRDFYGKSRGKWYSETIDRFDGDKIRYKSGSFDYLRIKDECVIIDDSREGVTE